MGGLTFGALRSDLPNWGLKDLLTFDYAIAKELKSRVRARDAKAKPSPTKKI